MSALRLDDRVDSVAGGRVYSVVVYYKIRECRERQGEVTPGALERDGLDPATARDVYELATAWGVSPVGCDDPRFWRVGPVWREGFDSSARFVREVW